MSNVVGLFGKTPDNEPVADIVELLEDLLVRAKNGELRGLAYTTVDRGDVIGTGWSGDSGTRNAIATSALMLATRIANSILDGK